MTLTGIAISAFVSIFSLYLIRRTIWIAKLHIEFNLLAVQYLMTEGAGFGDRGNITDKTNSVSDSIWSFEKMLCCFWILDRNKMIHNKPLYDKVMKEKV